VLRTARNDKHLTDFRVLIRLAGGEASGSGNGLLWDFAFYVLNLTPTAPRQHRNNQGAYGADPDEQRMADSAIKESFK
jgi:hypothetical protein